MQNATKRKGWLSWLLTVMVLLLAFNLSAQVTVTLGTGTTNAGYPFYTLYEDSRTQMIYDASEILAAGGAAGTITSIAFNVMTVGSPGMNGFSIDMQNYSSGTLTGFVSSGWTNTYSGAYTVAATGWQTITLTTPFVWDGTSNLLINVCYDNAAWSANTYVYNTAVAGKTWHQHTDGAAGCSLAVGAVQANRPNIQLTIQTGPPPPPPLSIQVGSGVATSGYPFYTYYMDSRTQMLYTATEIFSAGGLPGDIISIGLNVTTFDPYVMNGFNIDMQNYAASTVTAFQTTGWTNVYSGTYAVTGSGVQTIELTTPFAWDGVSNLLISICFNNTDYADNNSLTYGTVLPGLVVHNHSDILAGDGCTEITTVGSTYTTRANMYLTIEPSAILPTGIVQGFVTNGFGVPLPDATVAAQNDYGTYVTTSGPNGAYQIPDISIGTYTMAAAKDGYNTDTEENVVITDGATTYVNFELPRPAMAITPNPYSVTVNPGEQYEGALNINNNGDGTLTWTAEVVYPDTDLAAGIDPSIPVVDFSSLPSGEVSTIGPGNGEAQSSRNTMFCPEGSKFSNAPVGANNGYTSTTSAGYKCYQQFLGVDGNFNTLNFWAIFTSAPPATMNFNIEICAPGATPGAVLTSLAVDAAPVNTGTQVIGYNTYLFTVELPNTGMAEGWISVQATTAAPTFYWLNTMTGTGLAYQNAVLLPEKLAMCLSGGGASGWLTLAQYEGIVNPYTNFDVAAFFNASDTEAGEVYTADVVFTSDPDVGTVTVPVTMVVAGPALSMPEDLTAHLVNPITGQVNLSWTFTPTDAFINFIVKRDGVTLGTTAATTFIDMLPTYGTYSYTVQAVYDEGLSVPAGPVEVEWPNPTVMVDPTSLYNEQYPNTSENVSLRVYNTGEGTLAFSFPEYAARQLINSPDFTPNVRSTVKEVEVAKGEADPTDGQGNRNLRGAGGPDGFGYMWIDSDESGGPAFVWNSIASTGTLLTGLTDDSFVGPVNLGINFPFYGNTYGNVYVSSNGFLSFGSGSSSLSNQNIPSSTTPNNLIAWFWDDLNPGVSGTVHYQTIGSVFVIQFTNYNEYGGTGQITAQVHLNQNGDVTIYYNTITGGLDILSATVGMENSDGTIGTNVNYNSAYVHNSLALWMGLEAPSFITAVSPAQGQVAAGEYVDVAVTFTSDDEDFPVGIYDTELEMNTNDLANEIVIIPATMLVYNPGQFAGIVTNAASGEPLNGVLVTANPLGSFMTLTYDDGTAESGWGINAGYDAWLGNYFPVSLEGTINSIDVHFIPPYGSDMTAPLTIDFYDNARNLIGTSSSFTVTAPGWYNVAVPDVAFNGAFYAMVHWNITGLIRYMSWDTNGPNAGAGYGYIMEAGVWSNTDLGAGLFVLRANVFASSTTDMITLDPAKITPSDDNRSLSPSLNFVSGYANTGRTGQITNRVNSREGSFQTMTNEEGEYSLYVDAGIYNVSFEKTGFQTYIEMDTTALEAVVTPLDAQLWEEAYPPSFVYAEVNATDTECLVTWGDGSGPYEVVYDDGSAENFAAWALPGNMNAVKFTPAEYPATVIGGKIFVGDGTFPNNTTGFLGTSFGAMVKDDDGPNGFPGTTLDSISVTVNNYGWVTFSGLDVEIADGNFYLVMVQGTLSPNCAPVGIDETLPTLYRSYSRNVSTGGAWGLSPFQDMMMRAIVYGSPSATDAISGMGDAHLPLKQRGMISAKAPLAMGGIEGPALYKAAVDFEDGSRAVTNYRLVRYSGFDPDGSPTMGTVTGLGNAINANTFTDGGTVWANLPNGWYAYGVAANYPNNYISDTIVSNIVGHGILAEITVNVTLTTGGSPAGAVVNLIGEDYPYEAYSATVPESGQIIFPYVWYGHYVVEAMKVGFDDYSVNVNITGDRTIDIMLAEKKYKPRNLYVDALTLVATWDEPLAIEVGEDFEGPVFPPAGWQALTQNTTGWYATTNGSSSSFAIPPHTTYAVTNDDADNGDGCCDYLITPQMDWTNLPSYRMNFASYYDGTYSQSAYVEISTDAGATWTVINTLSPAPGAWQNLEIDLAQYSGATGLSSVWVAFHADDNGAWASGWAVDDIQIASGGVPLQGYGVFLDGTLVDNTPERTYTYQDLNYGQEYLAGVAALYSSGYSELDTYLFRSMFLYPPQNLMGESPFNTDYAHLWWEQPGGGGGAGGSLIEDFEAGVLSEGWEIIQTNTAAGGGTPAHWTVNDYSSADFAPFGMYHAGLWWDYGHQDEWLITPEVACGAATQLSFESTVYEGSTYLDHYYVKVSTDGGTTWEVVWDASTLTGGGWNYYDYPYTIDLSAFAGEDIKIAFQAIDGDGAGLWYIWFVDNIAVGDAESTLMFPASSLTKVSNSTNRNTSDRIARDGNIARVANSSERTNRAVMGLIGYNLYRDNALAAYVAHPTTEHFDLNLDPGTYSYHVTAVYDLTPYGFAGQTGESMMEGPIDVRVIYGYNLPFIENWNTGLFETNQWTIDGSNWRIAGQTGNPLPSAEFTYNPVQTDYALSLTSSWINGFNDTIDYIDGKLFLDFDLKLDDVNATGDENLQVEVYNGAAWITVATYTAEGDMAWEMKHVDITNQARNKVFRVRFNAKGMNTLDIFNWQVDNIHIYRVCPPPVNLVSDINFPASDQVILTWEAPEGGGPGISAWLAWDDGTNADAIGLTGGGTFSVASRFTPAQLAQYAGTSLTKIRMYPYSAGGTIVLKVWTGANASQLVLTQPVGSYNAGVWNEFILTTPVSVTGATELWFGYTVTHGADYVAGCDAGPAVAGFGDMISIDGSVWESMATAYNLNYNWNLQGYVESVDGVTALSPIVDNTVYGPPSQLVRGNLPMLPNATVTNNTTSGSRELVGYNVYRDGVLIANTTETEYLDTELALGTYCYVVTALYEDCESDPSNEECEVIDNINSPDINSVSVYPNPSNSVVNIKLTNSISQVVVYNYVGQVVFEQNVTKAMTIQLNVRNYESGAYLVKFVTSAGDSFTKKVVVTK